LEENRFSGTITVGSNTLGRHNSQILLVGQLDRSYDGVSTKGKGFVVVAVAAAPEVISRNPRKIDVPAG
jgi:hypothetical protein